MKILPKVAIVGEPSAGKSTFFNRLAEQRKAIVSETRGITRDRLYSKAEWLGREFTLIDTGGIVLKDAPFSKEIKVQAEIAMKESDVILFLVDGRLGITDDTLSAAKLLKKVRETYPKKDIWCYSGYLFDRDMVPGGCVHTNVTDEMLSYIDVLVDGEFKEALKDVTLVFRGSQNQRIINVKESKKQGKVVLEDY